jgi:hypothetical protein
MRGFAALPRFVRIEPVGQCKLRCKMSPIQVRTDGAHGEGIDSVWNNDAHRRLREQLGLGHAVRGVPRLRGICGDLPGFWP